MYYLCVLIVCTRCMNLLCVLVVGSSTSYTIFHLLISLYGFMLRKDMYIYNTCSYATIITLILYVDICIILNFYVNTSFLQMAAFRKLLC